MNKELITLNITMLESDLGYLPARGDIVALNGMKWRVVRYFGYSADLRRVRVA